ncbi:MAG: AI-2E family transporter [Rubrobacter sp.]|nr:AI-2E family transporter [Rubrobacter sp.]
MPAKKLVVSTYFQYILIALGVFVLATFVPQIWGVLLTFFLAAVLAYILNPVVRWLERWRVPRSLAVIGVFVVLIAAVLAALVAIIVPAVRQAQTLIEEPEIIVQGAAGLLERGQDLPYVGERVAELDQQTVVQFAQENAPPPQAIVDNALGLLGGVFGIFGVVLNLFLMLIISIYLLIDRERITGAALGLIPETMREQTVELFHVVESTLFRFLKAQLFLCVLMGVIGWAIAFFTIGEYAVLIGLWVGFLELIPVLGAILGAVPVVLLALLDSPTQALLVAGIFLVVQQIEGNVLVPRITGDAVRVHPLWVLFALLAATALYGIVGAIFAVPIVAIIAAAIRYLKGTLVFESWRKPPLRSAEETPEPVAAGAGSGEGDRKLEGE